MSAHLVDAVGTTDALSAVFSDEAVLQTFLDIEAALARVQAQHGIIPDRAAAAIVAASRADRFDAAALSREGRASATPIVPLVAALRAAALSIDPASADAVHFGVTSQDISDTALVVVIRRAAACIATTQARVERSLRARSDEHAGTVMTGRTLLQPAMPITFGLKIANWYAGVRRAWLRLREAVDAAAVVQCGGAAGTLSAFGPNASTVRRALAQALDLHDGPPWHTQRDRLAAVACDCGTLTGALGKIARDISLLMQHEVAEAFEPGGRSSAMPHKRNPAGCAIALSAAVRTPGLVAAYLSAMVQEHERALGGWQAEWPILSALMQATGAASEALAGVAEGLSIDTARMQRNLQTTPEPDDDLAPAEALRRELLQDA